MKSNFFLYRTSRWAVRFLTIGALGFLVSCNSSPSDEQLQADNSEGATKSEMPKLAEPADDGKGVGPIENVDLPATVDETLAAHGKEIFATKCSACHEPSEKRKVGPGVAGVTERRKPEWIMNMILNPEVMVKEDPQAKALFAEYLAPMANQNLTEEEARAVLEYFRQIDQTN